MNNFIIFLAQTKTSASLEIFTFLAVAAIIGYITAWLYYDYIYKKKFKTAKSEIGQLQAQNNFLKIEKSNMHENLQKKDHELGEFIKEVIALRLLRAEDVKKTEDIQLEIERKEELPYEKDEALIHIAARKHLLDYKSFGIAKETEKDDLKMISGIGQFIEERLHALDIYTFSQISKFTTKDIETINEAIEYFSGRIERDEWVTQAKELLHDKDKKNALLNRIMGKKSHIYYTRIGTAIKEEADDLTVISGIGGWIQEKLNTLDIFTFRQIRNFTEEDVRIVTEVIEYFPGRIERDEWIVQAHELVRLAGDKTALMKRIKDRKDRIYYDRLGIAHKHHANNLTLIKGIGLWIEERLNLLDIYTFEQISKFNATDIDTITEILEISPGRIERDNWVMQAKMLSKKESYLLLN